MLDHYVLPPEHTKFLRGTHALYLDPVKHVWFATDATGALCIDAMVEHGRPSDAICAMVATYGEDARAASTDYVHTLIDNLLSMGYLSTEVYQKPEPVPHLQAHPTIMYIHLTSRCNLKCPYCYNQEHRHDLIQSERGRSNVPGLNIIGDTGEDWIVKLIDDAVELGVTEVKLTGGEALLHPGALRIARYAKEKSLFVNLMTNATLITDELAKEISAVVSSVSISLDSRNPEEHDAVRGKDTHAKVIRAYYTLRSAGVKHIHLNSVVTPVNLESLEDFLDYAWNELAADEVTFAASALYVLDPRQKWGSANYALTGEQFAHAYEQSRRFYNARTEHGSSEAASFRKHCGVGNGIISIDANGDVYPCQTLHSPEFLCGNIFRRSLKDILATEGGVLDQVRQASVDYIPECKECPVRYICSSGCRAEAYTREGDFLARNRALCPTFYEEAVNTLWNTAGAGACS